MESAAGGDAPFHGPRPQWINPNAGRGRRRQRTIFDQGQLDVLVRAFDKNRCPGFEEREELAGRIGAPESRVQVWFQNRRARYPCPKKKDPVTGSKPQSQPSSHHNMPTPPPEALGGAQQGPPPGGQPRAPGSQGPPFYLHLQGAPLPSTPAGLTPPLTPPWAALAPSVAFPASAAVATLPPPVPSFLHGLPPLAAPPALCAQLLQGLWDGSPLPVLTQEDLAILHLPA